MPAKKPNTLNSRHNTKADILARAAAESAMTPRTELTVELPRQLTGRDNAHAAKTWARTVALYAEVDGNIATAFDVDLLTKYCLLEQEVIELGEMRKTIKADWITQKKVVEKIKPNDKTLKEYVKLWEVVNGLFQRFQGIDARLDGKRKLLHSLAQSLYLTPRSRAGVDPKRKEPEQVDMFSDFDK